MMQRDYERYVQGLAPAVHPSLLTIAERRQNYRRSSLTNQVEAPELASVDSVVLELEGRDLRARLYVPHGEEHAALVLYFHGGSFVLGDLDTHDTLVRRLSADTRMRFLAVEYRLAPEHPFPAAIDDAVDALRYVAAHRSAFGAEGASLLMMGDSAGAALVTVAATLTRGEDLGVAGQVLVYPTLGPEVVTDSSNTYATGFILELEHLRFDYGQYLGEWTNHADPRVSPLFAVDLTGVAPAIVVVAECDPLRDEGVAYAGLLEHFGVRVQLLEAEGMLHGFLRLSGVVPEALEILDAIAEQMHQYVRDVAHS